MEDTNIDYLILPSKPLTPVYDGLGRVKTGFLYGRRKQIHYRSDASRERVRLQRYVVSKVGQAIKSGYLIPPDCCDKCGRKIVHVDGHRGLQAHHEDYSKPLSVVWLCPTCHRGVHKRLP